MSCPARASTAYKPNPRRFNVFYGLLALGLGWFSAPSLGHTAAPPLILALGDSLTSGYGLAPEDALPARLEIYLKSQGVAVKIKNAGVSGDTTAGGRARLAWALADKPAFAILALGANDGLRGVDPALTRANLDAILTEMKARGVKVLLAGMRAPPNLGRRYAEEFNALFPALAEKHDLVFYPFLLDGVAAEPGLNQADGIHPNAQGVAVMVARMAPYIRRLMAGY